MANDQVDDFSIKSHKDKITDLLDKRHRERLLNLDTKHELHKKNAAETEDHEYFLNTFRDHAKQIDDGMMTLRAGESSKLTAQISQLLGDIQNLQNYLTSSTLFLSTYTIKTCQTTINELKTKLEATKSKLIIKKKFGFRSKVEIPTPTAESIATPTSPSKDPAQKNGKVSAPVPTHINWTVQNRIGAEIVIDGHAVDQQDITMANLTNCIIKIFGHASSLQFSHLKNCIVLSGPVCRSVFADNCTQTKFSFGCQQLRLHSSTYCDLYMHVTSRAIIEDCTNIRVASNIYRYDGIDNDFIGAGLDVAKNNWDNVADFNWLSTNVNSPNWAQMDVCGRIIDWEPILQIFREDFKISI